MGPSRNSQEQHVALPSSIHIPSELATLLFVLVLFSLVENIHGIGVFATERRAECNQCAYCVCTYMHSCWGTSVLLLLYNSVCVIPFFVPFDIQHNQCPCRFFNVQWSLLINSETEILQEYVVLQYAEWTMQCHVMVL